ncbi:MAG: TonB-dependent receptor, partial [Bacteroidota bacterium]
MGYTTEDNTFTANPFQDWENPLAITDGNERGYKSRRFLGNAFLEISFLKNFTFKSNIGIEQSNGEYTEFIDPFRTSFGRAIGGRGVSNVDKYSYRIVDNILTYEQDLGDHKFDLMAGVITQYYLWEDQGLSTTSFAGDEIQTAGAGSIVESYGVSKSERKNISYISRVNYSYQDRYLLTVNLRRDGSSIFGPDNRIGYFPSASLGWRLSNEPFLASKNWLSDLRIRAGWGVNGNDPISPYSYLGITSTGANYPLGNGITPGIYPSTIENRDLKWEETRQINLGFDVSILNGRFSATVDLYDKQTNDVLLGDIPIPLTSGFSSARGNAVGIQNRGVEFLFNSVNVDKVLKWTTNLNFSINRNKIT